MKNFKEYYEQVNESKELNESTKIRFNFDTKSFHNKQFNSIKKSLSKVDFSKYENYFTSISILGSGNSEYKESLDEYIYNLNCEVKLSNKIGDKLNILILQDGLNETDILVVKDSNMKVLYETGITFVKASDHWLNDIIKLIHI